MALAYEIHLGKNVGFYDALLKQDDPEFFQYALGLEAARYITAWPDMSSVSALVVCMADRALNTVTPAMTFVSGLQRVASSYPRPPAPISPDALHDSIAEDLKSSEADRELSEDINEYLTALRERASSSDDVLDKAVESLLDVMIDALDLRWRDPAYFTRTLLHDFANPNFISRFYMPLYRTGTDFVDTGNHPLRYFFVLFCVLLDHRLRCLVEPSGRHAVDTACPLLDSSACTADKDELCGTRPWERFSRLPTDTEGCAYELVEVSLHGGYDNVR